jgi:[ribosomal protein S18]-alanine N-acetyltransferase
LTVSVQRAAPGDAEEVARFERVFDTPVRRDQTDRFLADARHVLILGYLDDQPAGFVSAVEVFHPDKLPELFLNEIGVLEEMRRRGVARALIDELKEVARERGCVNVWVLTDESNEGAMALYRGTGGEWDGNPQAMFEYDVADE